MNRRNFIHTTGFACLGAGTLPLWLSGCSNVRYVTGVMSGMKLVVKKADFVITKNDKPVSQSFVLIKNEQLPFPICIYTFDNDQYCALYMECTHQGCEVNAYTTQLVCPCHGSEFSNTGKVIQGPAEKDLHEFPVTVDSENIFIQLSL